MLLLMVSLLSLMGCKLLPESISVQVSFEQISRPRSCSMTSKTSALRSQRALAWKLVAVSADTNQWFPAGFRFLSSY
jgi:hypothetical protein